MQVSLFIMFTIYRVAFDFYSLIRLIGSQQLFSARSPVLNIGVKDAQFICHGELD